MAEVVLIEFVATTEGLAPAVDQLERLGQIDKATATAFKATNAELKAREATLKATGTATKSASDATKKSIVDVDNAVKNLTNDFVQGFQEGVIEALKEAGVSAEQFSEAMKSGGTEVEKTTESIRSRLKAITQELQVMKVNGENATNPERYAELTREAGNLQSALGDVNAEIARAGSSTGAFDSLIQISQGVAGGFAVAQGAAAIFGDESEELQEVLLRVNAAMAVLQGLQQVQAAWAARLAIARGLETAATQAQTVAQIAYNVVVGQSIGLMRVLRIAFASTGIGFVVLALVALIAAFKRTSAATKQLIEDLETLNFQFELETKALDEYTEAIRRNGDEQIATLEATNTLGSEVSKQRINNAQQELQAVLESEKGKRAQYDLSQRALLDLAQLSVDRPDLASQDTFKKLIEQHEKFVANFEILEKRRADLASQIRQQQVAREQQLNQESLESQIATTERVLLTVAEGSKSQLALQQKLVRDKLSLELNTQALTEAQRLQLIEAANREQLELRLAFNKRSLDLEIRGIEDRLRSVEEGSSEELRLRIDLLRKQAAAEVSTTRLSEAEKQQIRQEAINEQVRLELAFAAEQRRIAAERAQQVRADFIQVAIARNQTELALAAQGSEERLHLEIVNIELAASEARRVAGQNAIEINRINAEAQAQILAVRRQFAEQAVEYEIRLEQAKNGRLVREQQRVLSDGRSTFQQRVTAINELFLIEVDTINRRLRALRDQFKEGLISQKEYNLAYAELEDERARISEETEQQILAATRERTRAQIQASIEVAGQLVGFLDSVYQAQSDKEQQRIEEQRTRIDELRESGAITEKEAERRRRLLEQEERRAQQRQAQREKQIAVFRALLAIPQAFLQGVAQGGPILGAIYAGIAAAQAALIISQPIPKFGKGKKNNYEGLAEVGETGGELIESSGQMYIAPKRTIVWLGAKDKVYNPKETIAMLEKPGLRAAKLPEGMGVSATPGMNLDYDKLGKTIAQHSSAVNLNIDGYKQFILNGHSFTTYLNNRRGY